MAKTRLEAAEEMIAAEDKRLKDLEKPKKKRKPKTKTN